MCNHLKPEIRKTPDVVIIHAGTNDLTSNTKSLENYKSMAGSFDLNNEIVNWKFL